MPLVMIVGLPCSGKSTRAQQLKEQIGKEVDVPVHIVSENDVLKSKNVSRDTVFMDSQKEKEIRGVLKSETLRLLSQQNIVILDAGNYIKGYRYELYCAAKNSGSTQVTIETLCPREEALARNSERNPPTERYSPDCFDSLYLRYEAPDNRNRWDSPLFWLQSADLIPLKEIYEALFLKKPPPPNQSTQSAPLTKADFLYELDKITHLIVGELLSAKKYSGGGEGCIRLPIHGGLTFPRVPETLTAGQLARYRRQFLTYVKLHPPKPDETPDGLAQIFARFLNGYLGGVS